ncbi:unnamed protein product [Ilex paraguariensis]|uniref:Methyltransferase PMT27 n=1 Tax=Ilex paraguariensis TaxID=185542 RepID=A0ABC8SM27_9AQUA
MALGKGRSSKRSSGTSYTSTVTTVVFVSLCVLGVWMLSSNSLAPPQNTTRTATDAATAGKTIFSSSITDSRNPERTRKNPRPVFEDNPGDLPNDAIQSDEHDDSTENQKSQDDSSDSTDTESTASGTQNESRQSSHNDEEVERENTGSETSNDDKQESEQEQEHGADNDDLKERGSVVDENPHGLQGKESEEEKEKQKALETQTSEESSVTQNQQIEETETGTENQSMATHKDSRNESRDNKESNGKKEDLEDKVQDENQTSRDSKNHESSEDTQHHISEEDQQQRLVQHQEQEEALIQQHEGQQEEQSKQQESHGATSDDQIKHDEEPPLSSTENQTSQETEETKHHVKNHETQHKSLQNDSKNESNSNQETKQTEKISGSQSGDSFPGNREICSYAMCYAVPEIAWGKHTRVVLDVGCGVASFGGFLFDRGVLAMSFAPKDEHEAQVQFALERGIPAISAVMGSQRLPFPSRVFDLVHCARCRVPWHVEGGALLLELNRMLRPGGYFVWSATPVYQKLEEDVEIWKEMSALTVSMCWELVTIKKDKLNSVGAAIYHKPDSNECYEQRKHKSPPMCRTDDDPNAAWYVPLQSCMHRVPTDETERGSQWPEEWPHRLQTPPYWLNRTQMGIYGKPAPDDFLADYEHWKQVVSKSYISGLGISWSNVRNVMDMRAVYGGFAAAMQDLKVWVLNVVNIDSPDTLPIIYERGLFGIYHDWCESFSTYPRTYDLLHADHLFSRLKKRCKIVPVMAEVDRIVRPGGKLIVRDESSTIGEVENILKSLHWEVHLAFSKNQEGILSAQKSEWRPDSYAAPS